MMHALRTVFLTVSLTLLATTAAVAGSNSGYLDQPAVRQFIDKMVTQHGFDRDHLDALFTGARHRQSIIDAMNRPAESLPWYRYRRIFLTSKRTAGGVQFWRRHQATLERAEKKYGVPAAILISIIGVESYYGHNKGDYSVIDALVTLGFDYPPRATFFREELAQYLLLSREQHFDPATVTGSYAGAMGAPQFIASSYRAYAIDFSGDGKSDLWNSWPDIIGSIANYFAENGWRRGGEVAVPATLTDASANSIQLNHTTTAQALRKAGARFGKQVDGSTKVELVALEQSDGKKQYWAVLHNFDVIMTYNHSALYAMAVYQLSNAIKKERHGSNG